jgi:FlaA1/EpsC-like NDP-sugar epimerase
MFRHKNKTILITGALGSIGTELVSHFLGHENKILALDRNDIGIRKDGVIRFVCDIGDEKRLNEIFSVYRPDLVIHTAAYKYVVCDPDRLQETIVSNVDGTSLLLRLAKQHAVAKFIFISTDKAVYPKSLMGATKLVGEMLTRQYGYTVCRLVNVMGSRGSVVEKWRQQMSQGLPVTVTHPDMERYFMTTEQVCEMVDEVADICVGSDTYVFDPGEATNILEMAKRMIHLSGSKSEVVITNPGAGEKFNEQLMTDSELEIAYQRGNFWIIR